MAALQAYAEVLRSGGGAPAPAAAAAAPAAAAPAPAPVAAAASAILNTGRVVASGFAKKVRQVVVAGACRLLTTQCARWIPYMSSVEGGRL